MGELAEALLIGASRCTRRVDRMVEAGLVERHRDVEDSRVVLATLTRAGRRVQRRAALTHLEGIQRHLGRFVDERLAADMAAAFSAVTTALPVAD